MWQWVIKGILKTFLSKRVKAAKQRKPHITNAAMGAEGKYKGTVSIISQSEHVYRYIARYKMYQTRRAFTL
jgi:hypothetical protein